MTEEFLEETKRGNAGPLSRIGRLNFVQEPGENDVESLTADGYSQGCSVAKLKSPEGAEMESADRISHVVENQCHSVKSKKNMKEQCTNTATHGDFCGIHYKNPTRWTPGSPDSIAKRVKRRKRMLERAEALEVAAGQVQQWYRFRRGFYRVRLHGPAIYARTLCTNDADFFSTDHVADISGHMFFSYQDADKHIYGFDIRSVYTLLHRARLEGTVAFNPFTRTPFSEAMMTKISAHVKWLRDRTCANECAPLEPPTPEQQWRMKIVDIFKEIDALNYYSSPDWFIGLDQRGQRKFYSELFYIWTDRAGLSNVQKSTIVPNHLQRIFRHPPWALADQTMESLQRINTNTIRILITSAEDRNDRILGAMYVVSTLTLVNEQAREAYPWLHESVFVGPVFQNRIVEYPVRNGLLGIQWLRELLAIRMDPPLLELPGPVTEIPAPLAPPEMTNEETDAEDSPSDEE